MWQLQPLKVVFLPAHGSWASLEDPGGTPRLSPAGCGAGRHGWSRLALPRAAPAPPQCSQFQRAVSRVYSLGNHCLTSWEPQGWARITMNFGLNDPWKQPGRTCSAMPGLGTGCLKKHHLGNKMMHSYGYTSSASGSKSSYFQGRVRKKMLRFRFQS